MEREKFVKLVEEALGALPTRLRNRIHNVAVLVENVPPEQLPRRGSRNARIIDLDDAKNLVLGVFEGVPTTKKSMFDLVWSKNSNGLKWLALDFAQAPFSNGLLRPRISAYNLAFTKL